MRKFVKDRKGASEIVGTALFLVILFFFFSNVFLWHDQVVREMDQVEADRRNTALRISASSNGSLIVLTIDNVGGLEFTLSRLWILTDDAHLYARLDQHDIQIGPGRQLDITVNNVTSTVFVGGGSSDEVRVRDVAGDIFVDYAQEVNSTVTYRVLTMLANSAACSFP